MSERSVTAAAGPSVSELFRRLGGEIVDGFPAIHSPVRQTASGVPYLQAPGVVLLAKPAVNLAGLRGFLEGFDPGLRFAEYLDDPTALDPGAQLCKVAGQVCYASFGPRRTHNAQASRYFTNIKASGHGSVLEHASYSALIYGVSRSVTHELVRHRAGVAVSQVSQRYVDGKVLRFVERPEYQADPALHTRFEKWIDGAAAEYATRTQALLDLQKAGERMMTAEARTDLRKKVQQAARSALPNETEAPLVFTANARALRHIFEMRCNEHAETEIRAAIFRLFLCVSMVEGTLFDDYRIVELPDGTYGVETHYRKV